MRPTQVLCGALILLKTQVLAKTYFVTAGQSIQAAINGAAAGDRVQVAAGTYAEQIDVTKNNLDLRASGTVIITPPGNPVQNSCSNYGVIGICVSGRSGVSITGFTVSGGFDSGILALNGPNTKITSNRITGSQTSSLLAYDSAGSKIQSNEVICGNLFGTGIDLYAVNNNNGGVKVAQNKVSNCQFGILAGYSPAADVENNEVSGTCGALSFFQSSSPIISHNTIRAASGDCPYTPVRGIEVNNVDAYTIDHNSIDGQRKGDGSAAAIKLTNSPNGVVTVNTLRNNDANIIRDGSSQTVTKNTCTNPSTNCNY